MFHDNLDELERMVPFRDVGERRARDESARAMAQCGSGRTAAHIARERELVTILRRAGFELVERWSEPTPWELCAKTASRSQSSRIVDAEPAD